MFLYVGELCRYLLAAPKSDLERAHSLQLMIGVGLRPNLWRKFRERFGVERILESYGSTEANCSLSKLFATFRLTTLDNNFAFVARNNDLRDALFAVNLTSHEGACGFIPKTLPDYVMRRAYPTFIIEVDHETGEPIRCPQTGLCITCPPGVAGCFVGRIINNDLVLSFEGQSINLVHKSFFYSKACERTPPFRLRGSRCVRKQDRA